MGTTRTVGPNFQAIVSATDPSLVQSPLEGQFWWDTANDFLSVWDATLSAWVPWGRDNIYQSTVLI